MSAATIRLPRRSFVNVRLGFALMRDHRVPLRTKVLALLMGLGITGLIELLEIPVEGILAAIVPMLGMFGDVVLDGAEAIAGPIVLAAVLLPFLAPREVVDRLHAERTTGAGKGPVVEL